VDWSLLGCGRSGHATYAPAEAELRERLSVPTAAGPAWRCLRCGTFVPGEPAGSGPAAAAPDVRRDKDLRGALILRIFAIERFLRALVFGVLAYGVWRYKYSRLTIEQAFERKLPIVRTLFHQLGFNINHSKLVGLIQRAFTLSPRVLSYLAIGLAAYVVIELIEGVGLWLGKRWGEYFAMVATSIFLPYEIYDMTTKITVTRVAFFLVNLALVVYLVITRRLFGVRGGKSAYEARLKGESILQAAVAAVAAERAAAGLVLAGPVLDGPVLDGPGQDEPAASRSVPDGRDQHGFTAHGSALDGPGQDEPAEPAGPGASR
jgi:uncharacterized membrane protein (DUF2068 family)